MLKGKSQYDNIYCNVEIENSTFIPIQDIIKIYAIENSLLVIDEASLYYNNRMMKMTDREIEYFKLHRHYKTDIIVISQSYDDIDITIRRLYDKMYILKKIPIFHLSILKEIKKFITIDRETEQIIEGYAYKGFPKLMYRKRYYKYFDSYNQPVHIPIYYRD